MTNIATEPDMTPIYDAVAAELGLIPSELPVPACPIDQATDQDTAIPLAS